MRTREDAAALIGVAVVLLAELLEETESVREGHNTVKVAVPSRRADNRINTEQLVKEIKVRLVHKTVSIDVAGERLRGTVRVVMDLAASDGSNDQETREETNHGYLLSR